MEGISNLFSTIGSWVTENPQQALAIGGSGLGLIQNQVANQQQQAKTNYVLNMLNNPAKFQALVTQQTQPLNQALVSDVSRQTEAQAAQSGLGSSPLAVQSAMAEALAPYEMQQQQTANQDVLSLLSSYMNSPTAKPVNIAPMIQAILGMKSGSSGGSNTDWTSLFNMNGGGDISGTFADMGDILPASMVGGGSIPDWTLSGASGDGGIPSFGTIGD